MGKAGLEIILRNAGSYLVLVFNGILRILLDPGAIDYLRIFRLFPEAGGLVGLIIDHGLVAAVVFLFEEMPLIFWANLLLGPVVV